jgi:hypothetical protein
MHDDVWNYYEVKITIGTSAAFEVRINGSSSAEISGTGNFGTNNLDEIRFDVNEIGAVGIQVDDVYANDGTFLGDIVVRTLYPNADGTHQQWTPDVAGTHYTRVNEHHIDGDGSFVYDSTAGHIDSYGMDDLPGVTVYGVQLNLGARKGDAGLREVAPLIRQSGTDYVGTTFTLSSDYDFYSWILDQDPTSADWTVATVNADECGVKTIT